MISLIIAAIIEVMLWIFLEKQRPYFFVIICIEQWKVLQILSIWNEFQVWEIWNYLLIYFFFLKKNTLFPDKLFLSFV